MSLTFSKLNWWRIWWLSLIVKLALAAILPLSPDEAYYWVWSQNLQLSYYDHPPFVAWLFWLGDGLREFGSAVRWPGIIVTHLSLWFWWRIFSDHFPEEKTALWWGLFLFMPFVGPGSLIVTPDAPLLLFWSASIWAWLAFLRTSRPYAWMAVVGGLLGLGFSSKYMIVLLPPLLLLGTWPQAKSRLSPGLIFVGALSFLIGALPVWLWNVLNDFVSIRFQLDHGLGATQWKPRWTIEYILAQIALVFPLTLYLAWRAPAQRLLHLLAWGPLLFFAFTSTRGYVEANWPIMAHPALASLAVLGATSGYVRHLRRLIAIWATLFLVVLGLALQADRFPFLQWTKIGELSEVNQIVSQLQDVKPLFARSYQLASILSFRLGRPVSKLRGMNRKDFFDYLPESSPPLGTFFLVAYAEDSLPQVCRNRKILRRQKLDSRHELWEVSDR